MILSLLGNAPASSRPPRRSGAFVSSPGSLIRDNIREAVSGDWVISEPRVNRISVPLAVKDDMIIGAYGVHGGTVASTSGDNGRIVRRWRLHTYEVADLDRLVGSPAPLQTTSRNPVSFLEVCDVALLAGDLPQAAPTAGRAEIAGYVLTVTANGRAVVTLPHGGAITVETTP